MQDSNKDRKQEMNNNIYLPKKTPTSFRQYVVVAVCLFLAFYVGVAWGKKGIKETPETNGRISTFVENLSNPKDIFLNTDKGKPENLDFDVFWQAWKQLDQNYVDKDKLDSQKRFYGAIRGMVQAIGDPYTVFMDPEESREFSTEMQGSFEGIGAELGKKDEILTVIAPIEGTPAEKAGIKAGDKIIKINGEMTSDISIDEAVKKIRGPKGTEVTLTIFREGESSTRDIKIIRQTIEVKSVIYEKKDNGVAYIRINKFSEDTGKEFNQAVAKTIADGSKGLVLDVRNNPGGFLNVSVDVASKFIKKGEVVVWEQQRSGEKSSYKATGGDALSFIPVVVLMNQGSASASEILAGALRDVKHSKLVGMKSFGKGSVQQIEELSDGSNLRVTIAKWLTPSGQSIHEVGLNPDIEIDISEEDIKNNRDPQLDRAIEELKKELR